MFAIQHVHPMVVHFPIVFFLTLAVFDAVMTARGENVSGRGAIGGVSVGLAALSGIFGLAAFYFGDVALEVAESGGFSSEVAEIHEGLGSFTAIAFAVWALVRIAVWWRNIRLTGWLAVAVPVIEVMGAVLLLVTAYYGGQLVYDLGVNVAHAATGS